MSIRFTMTHFWYWLAAFLIFSLVLIWTSTASQPPASEGPPAGTSAWFLKLPDGRNVQCVAIGNQAITCDWEGAR